MVGWVGLVFPVLFAWLPATLCDDNSGDLPLHRQNSKAASPSPPVSLTATIAQEQKYHTNNLHGGNNHSRAVRKVPPEVSAATLNQNYHDFLTKDIESVQRHVKSNEDNSVAAVIAASVASGIPPNDYYICSRKYELDVGTFTPLIHSLCTWWSQTESGANDAHAQNILCRMIKDKRQCFRFVGDEFIGSSLVSEFTGQCPGHCIGIEPQLETKKTRRNWGARDL